MRKVNLLMATAIVLIGCSIYACNNAKSTKEEEKAPVPSQAEMVKRGEYLVASVGCDDCHSPKKNGSTGPGSYSRITLVRLSC